MDKKTVLREILFVLSVILVAAAAAWIQFIGREYEGDYSGFITSGKIYGYNTFSYLIGLVLFIGYIIFANWFFYRRKSAEMQKLNRNRRLLYTVSAFVGSLLMLAALVGVCFLWMGISVRMNPEWLGELTVFGWPIGFLLYRVLCLFIRQKGE